jgi:nitrite reductase/ring-hydroxylating ferredoxin subunit
MAWSTAAKIADFSEKTLKAVIVDGKPIIISKLNDRFFAIDAICPHKFGYLPMGSINGTCIVCPAHGAEFDFTTGKLTKGLAPEKVLLKPITDLNTYEVIVEGEDLKVNI